MQCDFCGSQAAEEDSYCGQCGESLYPTSPEDVFHTFLQCPYCNTMKPPRVKHTPRPWRIICCDDCGQSYKTLELIWLGEKTLELAEKHKSFLKT